MAQGSHPRVAREAIAQEGDRVPCNTGHLSAVAINLIRIGAWLDGTPLAPTRQSSFERLIAQAA